MYRLTIIILLFAAVYASTGVSIASAPVRTLNEYSVQELVAHFASQYSVSAPQMLATMECESSLNPEAIGDHDTSFGLAQIHLPAWETVSRAQAFDKVFATEFMAQQFALKHQRIWSCYRKLYT